MQLGELQEELASFDAQDTVIWGIAPDDPTKLCAMREDLALTFPILVDPELAATDAFGIRSERQPTVPHPTVVIVDRRGEVAFFHLDENYRRRPPASRLLDAVAGLSDDGPEAPPSEP